MEKVSHDIQEKVSGIENINIEISAIEVGERFRKDMGNIEALASSINKEGLIQPISICKNDEGAELEYKLIAGGRRYSALNHLISQQKVPSKISCRIFPQQLDNLQLRVLEFSENLYRKDMTWQEECNLKNEIHSLQQKIHGVKTSTALNATGWSLTDLSEMTGKSKGSLSSDINLSKMMVSTPEIAWDQFKTKNDAQKALKQAKRIVVQSTEAKQAKISLGEGDSMKQKLIKSYHISDFFLGTTKIGDGTMDFVEIDPPYGIDLENQKKDYNYTGYNEVSSDKYPKFMQDVLRESYRVLKTNGWMICWFGPEPWFEDIYKWIIGAEFKARRIPGIWTKGVGQTKQPDRILGNSYEMFFIARKGIPILNRPGANNVFDHTPIPGQLKVHPTERPVELMETILTTFVAPGANVLVPFAGSGNTLIAAAKNNMVSIGFDLTEEYQESYIIKIYKAF